jgi:hypothetical protein
LNELSFRVDIKIQDKRLTLKAERCSKKIRSISWKISFALLLSVLFCGSVNAQLSTATLFGTITDSTGAAIPKANVTITQTDTGFVRGVVTNDSGNHRADFLPIGPYRVTVTATGFKKLDREGVVLTVTEEAHLDLSFTIGGGEQTIEVTAEIPLINTGNSTLGRTISNVEIDNLPLVDRNVYTLLDLTPGVQETTTPVRAPTAVSSTRSAIRNSTSRSMVVGLRRGPGVLLPRRWQQHDRCS